MSILIEDVLAGRVDFSDIIESGSERLPPGHLGEILADIRRTAGSPPMRWLRG